MSARNRAEQLKLPRPICRGSVGGEVHRGNQAAARLCDVRPGSPMPSPSKPASRFRWATRLRLSRLQDTGGPATPADFPIPAASCGNFQALPPLVLGYTSSVEWTRPDREDQSLVRVGSWEVGALVRRQTEQPEHARVLLRRVVAEVIVGYDEHPADRAVAERHQFGELPSNLLYGLEGPLPVAVPQVPAVPTRAGPEPSGGEPWPLS